MTQRGVRKIQMVSVIFFGVSLLLGILAVLLQHSLLPLFISDPDVRTVTVIPWLPLIKLFVSLALAVTFLILCGKIHSDRASVVIIRILLIFLLLRMTAYPWLASLEQSLISAYGTRYIAAYSNVTRFISWATLITLPAANILMRLSMGGFYKNVSGTETSPGMTVRGARKLHIVASALCGAALLVLLLLFLLRNQVIRFYFVSEELESFSGIPSIWIYLLIPMLIMFIPPVFSTLAVCRKRSAAKTKRPVILFSILSLVVYLVCSFLSFFFSILSSRMYGTTYLATYSVLMGVYNAFVSPIVSASHLLMVYALGGYYGKE